MAAGLRALGVEIEDVPAEGHHGAGMPVHEVSAVADWVVRPRRPSGVASTSMSGWPARSCGSCRRPLPWRDGRVEFDGDPQARVRPMGPVLDALRTLGVALDDGGRGTLPVVVDGTGSVRGGPVTLDASSSSQFISALLLAGARYDEGVTVHHDGKPVPSEPHIAMTVETLRDAGVVVDDAEPNTWRVEPSEISSLDVLIEPDLSNAGPFLAAALVTAGRVRVPDWPQHTTQAGDALRDILDGMGADVSLDRSGLTVTGTGEIEGIDVDLHDASELTPVVAALAALAQSPSWIRGVAHIRGHETDRIAALATELNALGGVGDRDRGRSPDHAETVARRAVPQLSRPPDGDRRRGPGAAHTRRRGRGHRHDGQDPARLHRPLGAPCSAPTPPEPEPADELAAPRRVRHPRPPEPARGRGVVPRPDPAHEDAVPGFVTGVDRGRYAVLLGAGVGGKKAPERMITAMRARELGRKSVVVGDQVALVGDTAGGPDALARIVRVEPRQSTLRRSADDTDAVERVIVANADQLVVVSALADPEPRPRLIDRCLVAAYDAGLDPLLVLTKADLVEPDAFLAAYATLAVPYVVTRRNPNDPADIVGIDEVRDHLSGRVSVLIGHSGVGKSTLVNRLVPDAERAVGVVNAVTGRGRHTSTSSVALPAARRRRLGHRHGRHPVVRTRPRGDRADHHLLPRPRTRDRRVPSRLHARRGGVRARRLRRHRRRRPRGRLTARLAAPAAARASRHGRVSGRVNRPP